MKDRFIICYPLHLLACRFRLHCPSKNPGLLQSRTTRLAALFLALILAAGVHPLSAEINSRHTLLWATFPYPPGVSTDFQKNRDLFLAPVMDPQEVAPAALRDENRITDFTAQQFNRLDGNICSDLLQLREAVTDGFNTIYRTNELLEQNIEQEVTQESNERQLYFKLRKERDAALENAWMDFFRWQSAKCSGEESWFSDPVADSRKQVDASLKGLKQKTLALRLAWFRFLSRLDLETRRKILLN